jgi:hypothetical protein
MVLLIAIVLVVVVGGVLAGLAFPRDSGPATSTTLAAADDAESQSVVTAMEPAEGALTAGQIVTLKGVDLAAVSEVTFNGVPATALTVVDDETVEVRTPTPVNFDEGSATVEVFAGSVPVKTRAALSFSYLMSTPTDRQLAYAFDHWNAYNTAGFGDLNPVGGDCMNFVSQALLARGWTMSEDWYSADGGADWAAAWGHTPSFDNWLRAHPELGAVELSLDERDQAKLGDLVMFDWEGDGSLDHIQMVSAVNADGSVIKMVGHNVDSDYRDLDTTITVDHPGGVAYFWSIP